MTSDEFNAVFEIARQNDLYVFSDEVYRFSEYDQNLRLPAMCDVYEKAISLGVMSKSFGLPGLRIGWTATKSKEVMDEMEIFKDYITICNSGPSEF